MEMRIYAFWSSRRGCQIFGACFIFEKGCGLIRPPPHGFQYVSKMLVFARAGKLCFGEDWQVNLFREGFMGPLHTEAYWLGFPTAENYYAADVIDSDMFIFVLCKLKLALNVCEIEGFKLFRKRK
jgi:hypothetical protein